MSDNRYYTGITKDINIRLKQHNAGQSKCTRKHLPCRLVYSQLCSDRRTARTLEVKIKNKGAKRFLLHKKFNEI